MMVILRIAAPAWAGRFRAPTRMRERTRWVFGVLALVYLLLTLLPVGHAENLAIVVIMLASGAWLVFSWAYTYLHGSIPVVLDVVDALALFGIASASPDPLSVSALLFGVVWYRALYGTTRRSVIRCAMYLTGVGSSLLAWHVLHGHNHSTPAIALLATFPFVLATVFAARQLSIVLAAREASQNRNNVLATTGSQLLGMTDASAIRDLGWRAMTDIAKATPGMVVLVAVPDGPRLRLERVISAKATADPDGRVDPVGGLDAVVLPLETVDGADPSAVRYLAALNAVAGTELQWRRLQVDGTAPWWMFLGDRRLPQDDVLLAVRSLANQLTLALSNSNRHEDLSTRARIDVLTGLVNRATFTAELTARRHLGGQTPNQVLFIDLDDFKLVNDQMGHQAGDAVLIEVAQRIRHCSRPADLCARLGGDEFALLLPATTTADAERIAERIVERVAQPIEAGAPGSTARVGASIGISTADSAAEISQVVHHADVAMYAAKALGKGRVQVFTDGMLDADSPRRDLDRRLRTAGTIEQLVVHFQPILTVADHTCRAVEALVRWQHPDRGLLEPAEFLPIAERAGAMHDVGAFVLRRACQTAALLNESRPDEPLAMHVNISAVELEHADFLDLVSSTLAESGLPAERLVLELTDNLPLDSVTVISRITALAATGVRIAIDDVGTGHFPLAALRSLPVGVIKLEQSFLDSAAVNAVDRAAAEAIVHMSTQLGMQTIARGAERTAQQAFSERLGIDAVQGFLHLRPVPADQLHEWLETRPDRAAALGTVVAPIRPKAIA